MCRVEDWFRDQPEGNGERTVETVAVPHNPEPLGVSQNARQASKRRGSYERYDQDQPPAAGRFDDHHGIGGCFLFTPAYAHHLGTTARIHRGQGLLSGIGHPLLARPPALPAGHCLHRPAPTARLGDSLARRWPWRQRPLSIHSSP